ncbi:MAG: high-potential iron-sulfur protein [Macromonas sp.]
MNSTTNTSKPNRRVFMLQAVAASGVLAAVGSAQAAAPMLAETDAQAVALGYKADATKVDKAKQAKFVAGSNCGNCSLYQGKAGDAAGNCPLFAGKQVSSKGWCTAWVKKA